MKLSLTLSLATSAAAFSPSFVAKNDARTSLNAESMNRAAFLQTAGAAVLATLALPQDAMAAKYGGIGRGSAGVIDPKDKIVDDEIFASEEVQSALKKIKGYLSTVESLQAQLGSDSQANIFPIIRKDLDFVELRTALNTFNSAYDEETQRGTDRIVRIIIQDIEEVEVNSKLKEGIPRSEKRLALVSGKLTKLATALSDIIAFA